MKVALTGKGGAGKSTVAGALIRHLAANGNRVVALDADPNPNLGISIGVPRHTVESMTPILNSLLASGYTHDDPRPSAEELLARYGVDGPDDIVLIATGKIERPSDDCLCCGSHNTTRQFFGDLSADDRIVIADLEAGLNDLMWAHPGSDDIVLAVSDGSAKSVEIARRSCRLAEEMGVRRVIAVANRMMPGAERQRLTIELGVGEAVSIPEDPAVLEADRLGVAAFDVCPDSPAVVAVGQLVRLLGTP